MKPTQILHGQQGGRGGNRRAENRFKNVWGAPSRLTSLSKFKPREFGSLPMAQSRQSTSTMEVKVGFLPGMAVTTLSSKPAEVFLTSLTYRQIKCVK